MEKEVSEAERKFLVRSKYISKIDYMLQIPGVEEQDLKGIIKGFFSEFLKLEYHFTYEELSEEFNKIYIKPNTKKEIDVILSRLSEVEYNNKTLDVKEIKDIFTKLRGIIESLIYIEEKEKQTLIQKIFTKKKTVEPPELEKMKKELSGRIKNPLQLSASQRVKYW